MSIDFLWREPCVLYQVLYVCVCIYEDTFLACSGGDAAIRVFTLFLSIWSVLSRIVCYATVRFSIQAKITDLSHLSPHSSAV